MDSVSAVMGWCPKCGAEVLETHRVQIAPIDDGSIDYVNEISHRTTPDYFECPTCAVRTRRHQLRRGPLQDWERKEEPAEGYPAYFKRREERAHVAGFIALVTVLAIIGYLWWASNRTEWGCEFFHDGQWIEARPPSKASPACLHVP